MQLGKSIVKTFKFGGMRKTQSTIGTQGVTFTEVSGLGLEQVNLIRTGKTGAEVL